jgi:hypothetical protein
MSACFHPTMPDIFIQRINGIGQISVSCNAARLADNFVHKIHNKNSCKSAAVCIVLSVQ